MRGKRIGSSIRQAFVGLFLATTLGSCAIGLGPYPADGILFSSYRGPWQVVPGKTKPAIEGKACAFNILGLLAIGDASIDAAKTSGSIKKVAIVDYSRLSVLLGLFSMTCSIVKGEG